MTYQVEIDWPDFLATYWQKKPVILKKVFPHFVDPISADELAGLAMENEVDSRIVSYSDNGNWNASHGPFERFDHLGEQNWSLLVQAVDHWHHPSAELLKPFRCLPQWRFDDLMVSFAVAGGGVGPHIDQYDVFIIQGMGKRHWRVGDAKPYRQFCTHPSLLHVEPFEAIIEDDLEPGDVLYIPPGFPHEGYSIENSLSYSVGFRSPNGQDLISSFADYVLEHDLGRQHYRDPELSLAEDNAVIRPHELSKIRQMMGDLINDEQHFPIWFGRFITLSRHELDLAPAEPEYQEDEVYDLLKKGESLRRLTGIRALSIDQYAFINGELIEMDNHQAAKILCQETLIDSEVLDNHLEDPELVGVLTEFINKGYWYFID